MIQPLFAAMTSITTLPEALHTDDSFTAFKLSSKVTFTAKKIEETGLGTCYSCSKQPSYVTAR